MQTKCRVMSDQMEAIYSRDIPQSARDWKSLLIVFYG